MRNAIFLLALLCAACSSTGPSLPSIRPYRMDVQQGNVVTPKMMMQLKPGMSKAQVRYIMGTPLIVDSFHSNRWDYFYSMKKNGRLIEQRRVIMEFESDKLVRVRGDVIPAGSTGAEATADAPQAKAATAKKKEEKGLLDRLKFWGDDKKPETPQEAKPAPAPKPQSPAEQAKPAPAAQPAMEEPPQAKPAEAPQEQKKGWLDKLKFWGEDKKPEPEAKPATGEAPTKAPEPLPQPMLVPEKQLQTAPAAEAPEVQPEPAPAPEAQPEPTAVPETKPEPIKPAEVQPKPVASPAKVEEAKPQQPAAKKPAPAAEPVTPKPVPKPEELPPEDDPTYFERMLEKIGF